MEQTSPSSDMHKSEEIKDLPTFSVNKEKSPSLASQLSRKSTGSRKLCRGNAIDADDMESTEKVSDAKATVIKRRMTLPASTTSFRRTLSEEARMGDDAAEQLEKRLKDLVSAFSARTKRIKEKITKPPSPSISDSEDNLPIEEDDLLGRLRQLCSPGGSEFGGHSRRKSVAERMRGSCVRRLKTLLNFFTCSYVLDADGWTYVSWLIAIAACFLYNAIVIPLRAVFPYQTRENTYAWQYVDYFVDIVYAVDIIAFKSHRKFIREGFWIKDPVETRKSYFQSLQFKIDLFALFPADILVALTYANYPLLRLPRLLKIDTYWELFQRFDTILASPHSARITKTLIYMIYMIHVNACVYYALSLFEGLCQTTWTYCPEENQGTAYVRCFYFATKTASSIGKNPKPENKMEYMYMTFAWLSGVFITAILIGQIRDIIATATKNQNEYRMIMYSALNYLHRLEVPKQLQHKVKLWLSYTWEQQKTLDESKILDLLPVKMRTDVALDLHVETFSKVKLFHHCEVPFIRDLVTKLKSIIFLPGDYICKKGEVGREMFIIQSGKINVIGGPSGKDILVTLGEGSVFGEIALLGIGGMNKRTADVRAAGFANLFVLHKKGLEEAIRDYPHSQEIIRKKAQQLMKENIKKAKAAAAAKGIEQGTTSPESNSSYSDEVIIKAKDEPKLIETMKKIFPPDTKMGMYLTRGSKVEAELQAEIDKSLSALSSHPPTPGISDSSNRISLDVDLSSVITIDSSDSFSPPPPSPLRSPKAKEDVFSPLLKKQIEARLQRKQTRISLTSSNSSAEEELGGYLYPDVMDDDGISEGFMRCRTPIPPRSPNDLDPPNPIQTPPLYAVTPIPHRISTDTQPDDDRDFSSGQQTREGLPIILRPPVYNIVPGDGISLSSSEESFNQGEGGENSARQMSQSVAARIASRFLTTMRRARGNTRDDENESNQPGGAGNFQTSFSLDDDSE